MIDNSHQDQDEKGKSFVFCFSASRQTDRLPIHKVSPQYWEFPRISLNALI